VAYIPLYRTLREGAPHAKAVSPGAAGRTRGGAHADQRERGRTACSGRPGYDDVASYTFQQTRSDPLTTSIDSATGCHWDWGAYEVSAVNKVGVTLWTYGAKVEACVRDGKVRKVNWFSYHHECWCTTWNFVSDRVEAKSDQSIPRKYIWRQYRGHFRSCITWLCKDAWPWVYVGTRGDGTFGTNGGGS
jgi:hypothetical protein